MCLHASRRTARIAWFGMFAAFVVMAVGGMLWSAMLLRAEGCPLSFLAGVIRGGHISFEQGVAMVLDCGSLIPEFEWAGMITIAGIIGVGVFAIYTWYDIIRALVRPRTRDGAKT